MQKHSKPQLTEDQQRDVTRASWVASASAEEIAAEAGWVSVVGPEPFALGVAQHTVKYLLEIIADLTGEEA